MNKIKLLRIELGLSQAELGEATGLKRWKIALIEGGIHMPSSDERRLIAEAIGVREEKAFPARVGAQGAASAYGDEVSDAKR